MALLVDQSLFLFVNSTTASSPILTVSAVFFAKYALLILLGVLMVISVRSFYKIRTALIGCTLAYAISQLIGVLWFRPRPFVDLEGTYKVIEKSALDKSFPSDHATLAFAAAALIYSFNPRAGYAAYGCAILIALSRIMVGVHYPSDVIAGVLLGAGTIWCVRNLSSHRSRHI